MKCYSCNNDINEDIKFCPYCGKKVKEQTEEKGNFCVACGLKLKAKDTFCGNCGHKVGEENESINTADNVNESKNRQPYCTGAIVWMIFVIVTLFFGLITNIIAGLVDYTILSIALLTMYILLLTLKNRAFLYPIIFLAIIVFCLNISNAASLPYAVGGLFNPVITGILIYVKKKS